MTVIDAMSDAERAEEFGPQWREIVAVAHAVAGAQPEQVQRLATSYLAQADYSVRADATSTAAYAVYAVGRDLDVAWDAVKGAAGTPSGGAWEATWKAVWDATLAVLARDLIGQNGFEQEQYDLLAGPWRAVFGPLHPDDAA